MVSPLSRSRSLLVVSMRRSGWESSKGDRVSAARRRCSKLSSTSSRAVDATFRFCEPKERDCSAPSAVARTSATALESRIGERSTNRAPSGNLSRANGMTASARAVFPTPPGPVTVIKRDSGARISSMRTASSRFLPTRDDDLRLKGRGFIGLL